MHEYNSVQYKTDDGSHDACPTCGGHAETKATTDASGHSYRLTCRQCPWSVPLSRPPTTTRDDAVLMADGGTTTTSAHDTARDRLANLTSEHARRVQQAIDGEDTRLEGADLRAVLAESNGRIAYLVQHRCGVEYVYRDGETIHARTRHSENKVWPSERLETEAALARRTRKRFDVVARENVPAWVRGGDSE